MASPVKVPYCLQAESGFSPKYFSETDGKFIFHLFSPCNGESLGKNISHWPTFTDIIIPFGVICYLKAIHFEENGSYVRDERMERGLIRLTDGKQWRIIFDIPQQMNRNVIKRGEVIGSLIFEANVDLIRYFPSGMLITL